MQNEPVTMNIREAANYLGIGVNKMYELAHSEDFTAALRIGKRILISREKLQDWIDENAGKPITYEQ